MFQGYIAEALDTSNPVIREDSVLDTLKLKDTELGAGNETVSILSLNGTIELFSETIGADSLVRASAMQAALIAIVTANTGRAPTDGEVIGYELSSGNLIWKTGGGGTSTAGQPFGLLLALTKAA